MKYRRNLINLIPFILYHLIPVFFVAYILFILVPLDKEMKITLLVVFVSIVYLFGLILVQGKFYYKSYIFVKCELVQKGLNIIFKSKYDFIPWEQIQKITFENRYFFNDKFWKEIMLGKSFGSFIITDNFGNKFELTPAVKNRDLLVKEIIEKAKLIKKFQGSLGKSNSGYVFWEKAKSEEEDKAIINNDSDVQIFKWSSFTDYLIVTVVFIVIVLAGVYIANILVK